MPSAGWTFACAVTLGAVVACGPAQPAAPPLRDPAPATAEEQAARRESRATWDASVAFEQAARQMTPQQVAHAEAAWRKNPNDLETLKKLLIHYAPDQRRDGSLRDTPANIAGRRPLILWLVEHHPESVLTWHADPRFSRLDPAADPGGYAEARRLWLAHTSRADARAPVLDHAATFFESTEPARAEALLTRARQLDPDARTLFANGEPLHWASRLADLYCQALAGSDAARRAAVLAALRATQDTTLLTAAGRRLWNCLPPTAAGSADLIALSKSSYERALQIDSDSAPARAGLAWLAVRERQLRLAAVRQGVTLDKESEVIGRLPERERLDVLPSLADEHYARAEGTNGAKPDGPPAAHYALSKRYAEEAHRLAATYRHDPIYGTVMYRASVTLAMHALHDGDRRTAVRYMLAAAKAPPTEELAWSGSPLQGQLAAALLAAGERESVATFLERAAAMRMFPHERERQLKAAADIRAGVRPAAY